MSGSDRRNVAADKAEALPQRCGCPTYAAVLVIGQRQVETIAAALGGGVYPGSEAIEIVVQDWAFGVDGDQVAYFWACSQRAVDVQYVDARFVDVGWVG